MLELRHFLRLPQLDPLVERLVADRPGLVVVAGLDPRPHPGAEGESFLPSGRSGVLRILLGEMLAAHPAVRAVAIVEDERSVRAPRGMERRVRVWALQPSEGYEELLDAARSHRPEMLVIDRLGRGTSSRRLPLPAVACACCHSWTQCSAVPTSCATYVTWARLRTT